jgi:hypothetical protein
MTRREIITEIEMFAKSRGLAPATVTSRAVSNSRLYDRLLNGGDCTTEVAARLRSYIATHTVVPPTPTPTEDAA